MNGKVKNAIEKARAVLGVSRVMVTGKPAKALDKVSKGAEIASKAFEIWELLKRK